MRQGLRILHAISCIATHLFHKILIGICIAATPGVPVWAAAREKTMMGTVVKQDRLGNVHELRNVLERAMNMAWGEVLELNFDAASLSEA